MPDRDLRVRSNDAGSGSPRRSQGGPSRPVPDRQREPLLLRIEATPELDPVLAAELAALAPDPMARAVISGHIRLLLAWNDAINLTSVTDPIGIARRHVADSLAALATIRSGRHASIVDLGSGGGFPAVPLAANLPSSRIRLVEATSKKARFLEAAVAATGLADRVAVVAARAETLAAHRTAGVDVVTARAVGSLADLVELGLPLLRPGGRLVAWKGRGLDDELAAASRAAAVLGGGAPVVIPAGGRDREGHVLVVVERRGPMPAGYPREPGLRRRRPW